MLFDYIIVLSSCKCWCRKKSIYKFYVFLQARKPLKKKGIEENLILDFKSGLICQHRQTTLRLSFRDSIQGWVF